MVRFLLPLFLIINAFGTQAQIWDGDEEHSPFGSFLRDSVDRIAFVELAPYALPGRYYRNHFYSKKRQSYSCESIIMTTYVDTTHVRCYTDFPKERWSELTRIMESGNEEVIESACYSPRNGILLYAKNGQLISYIEICFECSHIYDWGHHFTELQQGFSAKQYGQLTALFLSSGMRYGVE